MRPRVQEEVSREIAPEGQGDQASQALLLVTRASPGELGGSTRLAFPLSTPEAVGSVVILP
jgi:hypothetical protein